MRYLHSVPSTVHFGIFWLLKHERTPAQQIRFRRLDRRFAGIPVLVIDIPFT